MEVAVIVYFQRYHPFTNDQEQSIPIFWIVTVGTALLVFLATRTKAGIILLFLGGNIVIAAAYFLQFPVQVAGYMLFLVSCFIMCMFHVYIVKLKGAHVGIIRFFGCVSQAVLVSFVGLLAAMVVFMGVIKPLNPPVEELKLITRLQSMEILQQIGVASVLSQTDYEKESNENPEDNRTTKEEGGSQSEASREEAKRSSEDSQEGMKPKPSSKEKNVLAVKYKLYTNIIPYLITAVVLSVIASVLLKKYFCKQWYRKVQALSHEVAVVNLYHYVVRKFSIMKYKKQGGLTPREFAVNMEQVMDKFDEGESSFRNLTEIYMQAVYGYLPVTEEERQLCRKYYERVHKNVRKEFGSFQYILHYFRL